MLRVVDVQRVSEDSNGVEANDHVFSPSFSPDGSKIVFATNATNLVANDINNAIDIFIKDLNTGVITRINTDVNGIEANGSSFEASFSPDGTKVIFSSNANKLVANDTNNSSDIFIKDLNTGVVTRISTNANGVEANGSSFEASFSPDGTKIIFLSTADNLVNHDVNGTIDTFIKDLISGEVSLVSTDANGIQGNGVSSYNSLSNDGSKILFNSSSSNLVANDTNGTQDIFIATLEKDLTIIGTSVDDSLTGGGAWDSINGGIGNDTIEGLAGNDRLRGWKGDDLVSGDAGNDLVRGDIGNDTLNGGDGNDRLYGDAGMDILFGGNAMIFLEAVQIMTY